MIRIALIAIAVAASSVATDEGSPRAALDRYYAIVPDVPFEDSTPYAEHRGASVSIGRTAIIEILHDLRSPSTSAENRRKALFALAAFSEEGAIPCEGSVIPTLISLLDDPDQDVATWSGVLLGESTNLDYEGVGEWNKWWDTDGRRSFADRCE